MEEERLWKKYSLISYFFKGVHSLKKENNILSEGQLKNFKNFLSKAELYDKKNDKTTKLYENIKNLTDKEQYQIILVNLYYNSKSINHFLNNTEEIFKNYSKINSKELQKILSMSKNQADEVIDFFNNFGKNGSLNFFVSKEGRTKFIEKAMDFDYLSDTAILYSLYKMGEKLGRKDFRLKEMKDLEGSPITIFKISEKQLTDKLKFISENTKLIDVNLIQGLDNIFLKNKKESVEILKDIKEINKNITNNYHNFYNL